MASCSLPLQPSSWDFLRVWWPFHLSLQPPAVQQGFLPLRQTFLKIPSVVSESRILNEFPARYRLALFILRARTSEKAPTPDYVVA